MRFEVEAVRRGLGRSLDRLLALSSARRLYLVGGAIRDVLLGRTPADFDFAVSESGVEFARQFARKVRGSFVELSPDDDEARVVRRELAIDFNGLGTKSIEEDLARRDFTVNAMAVELTTGYVPESQLPSGPFVIDPFGGQEDLGRGLIRPVSPESLSSDPLRLLRAMRLALELGMRIDESVYEQARASSLERTAAERVGAELLRVMESARSCPYIVKLWELGRLAEILPELVPVLANDDLREHSFRTYAKVEDIVHGDSLFSRFEPERNGYFSGLPARRALLKLSGLVHDIAKPATRFETSDGDVHFYGHDSTGAKVAAKMVHERLRLSRPQVKMVRTMVQEHMRLHLLATNPDLTARAIRRFFRDLGDDAFGMMILCVADGWATAGRTRHLEDTIVRMFEQKRAEDEKASRVRLVTGHDLIALGLKPGPAFKVILDELMDLQAEDRISSREEALEYLKANLPGLGRNA